MAWGSKNQIINNQTVTTSEVFSSAVTLSPRELAHVEVEMDPPASPTDDLIVNVYGTLDATSESWDEVPLLSFLIANGGDTNPVKAAFITPPGLYKFRLGVVRSGSTDSIVVDAWERRDGVSA